MEEHELNNLEPAIYTPTGGSKESMRGWIKVGAVAAASALAGGMAAAWFYRKTLKTLQEAESSEFGIPDGETDSDL